MTESHESLAPTRRGVRGRVLNLLMRSYFKRRAAHIDLDAQAIAEMRVRLEHLAQRGARPKRGVRISSQRIAGVDVEIVDPDVPIAARPTVLYFHGGGFLAGSPRTHRGITCYLARALVARVIVPDYRLLPEHSYPAALNDVVDVYAATLAQTPAARIAFAGDSAGGNLVVSAMFAARERGLPMPVAAVAISPWTDLTGSGESIITNAKAEAMLPTGKLDVVASLYAGDTALRTPAVSPLFGDMSGLPPLLVHVGTHEILLDDARRLVERAVAAGVEAQLRLWYRLPHVFHAFSDYLPAARVALDEINAFLHDHLSGAASARVLVARSA